MEKSDVQQFSCFDEKRTLYQDALKNDGSE